MGLKRIRESVGLSQEKLARAVGVSVDTVRNWERGNIPKQWEYLFRMADALGCRPEDLIK